MYLAVREVVFVRNVLNGVVQPAVGMTHKRTIGNGGAPPSPERLAAGSIPFNAVSYMPSILSSNAAELTDVL